MSLFYACLFAFLSCGVLCAVAQLLIDLTALTPARILVLYAVLGVACGAVGLYEPLRRFGGQGVGVTLFGFGGNIALGVREAVHREGLFGALTGALSSAAAGTTAALLFGYLAALVFRSKPKRL